MLQRKPGRLAVAVAFGLANSQHTRLTIQIVFEFAALHSVHRAAQ
jgi:hypothetical protein